MQGRSRDVLASVGGDITVAQRYSTVASTKSTEDHSVASRVTGEAWVLLRGRVQEIELA